MWQPESTSETVRDESDEENGQVNLPWLLTRFVALAAVVGVAGYFVADTESSLRRKRACPNLS